MHICVKDDAPFRGTNDFKKWPFILVIIMSLFFSSLAIAEDISLDVDGYQQTKQGTYAYKTCGAACSLMILNYSNCSAVSNMDDVDYYMNYLGAGSDRGLENICAQINNHLGQSPYSYYWECTSVSDLENRVKNSLLLQRPLIASINSSNAAYAACSNIYNSSNPIGHYVVISGMYYNSAESKTYFEVKDPMCSVDKIVHVPSSVLYNAMPYPNNGNQHPIIYGTKALKYPSELICNESAIYKGKGTQRNIRPFPHDVDAPDNVALGTYTTEEFTIDQIVKNTKSGNIWYRTHVVKAGKKYTGYIWSGGVDWVKDTATVNWNNIDSLKNKVFDNPQGFELTGQITCTNPIKSITVEMRQPGTFGPYKPSAEVSFSDRVYSYNIGPTALNTSVKFGNLTAGKSYQLVYTVTYAIKGETDTAKQEIVVPFSIRSSSGTVPVSGVTLNANSATLKPGESKTLSATVSPSNATNKAITWSSSNTSVATVSSSGVVTAVASGTATITCTAADGSGCKASCTVAVAEEVYLDLNGWLDGKAVGRLDNYGTVDVYINGSLYSDDVTDHCKKWPVGTTYQIKDIKTKTGCQYNGVYSGSISGTLGSSDVDVVLSFSRIPVSGIVLSPAKTEMIVGESIALTATVSPSNAYNKAVTWSSSDASVATVSSSGVVTAVAGGNATITCTAADGSGRKASCTVAVPEEVYLDLNGYLNDQTISSLNGYGTVDIYINGNLVKNDVQDYREKWPVGTTYEIKDIRATQAFAYNGVYSGSLSGKLGSSDAIVVLNFERPAKPVVSVTPGTKYAETIISWTDVSRTTHYDVRIFDSNMDDVFESYRRQTCDKTQFSALLSPGTYYVSVSASNIEKSTWNISNKVQFTVADANDPTPGTLAAKAEGNHKLYAVYSKACTWLEAEYLAEQSAGSFVSITSQAEQDVIAKLCAQVDYHCWIGAERFRNNKWTWVSGENFDNYTNWCDGEPSDTGTYENVAGTYSTSGEWNDYRNSSATPGGYILEYEPIALNVTSKEDAYEEHKVFSKNDLKVKVTFADGTTLITDDYTLGSQDCVNGNHIVMVYYGGIELCAHVTVPSTPTYATGTCGNNLTWEYSNNVLMIEGSGPMSTYDYNTNNPPPWSAYREVVKQVVIEKGVTSIGSDAFMDMINLTQVSIPNTVTDIRNYTFYGCTSLKNIVIPASVKKIGNNLFNGCSSLTSISLPEGLESIGEYAFNMCTALESVNVPEGITILNKCTFQGCENLSVVKLPNSLTTIGWSAFNSCIGLNSITIPDNVSTIEQFAFSQCKNLATIQMPKNLENVGFRAFYNCEALTRLILPECLETIGERAFDGCSNLANIYVYADETSIHDLAFHGLNDFIVHCYEDSSMHRYADSHELEYVLIPRHNEAIKVELPSSLIVIEEQAFANNTFECVVIPDGCTTIKAGAFEGNTALRFVEIPASVKQIDATAFKNCNSALVFITEAGSAAESYANSHSIYCVFR